MLYIRDTVLVVGWVAGYDSGGTILSMCFLHTCNSRNRGVHFTFAHKQANTSCLCVLVFVALSSAKMKVCVCFAPSYTPTYALVYLYALYRVSHCGNQFVSCTMKNHPHLGIGRSLSFFSSSAGAMRLRTNTSNDSHHRASPPPGGGDFSYTSCNLLSEIYVYKLAGERRSSEALLRSFTHRKRASSVKGEK